MSMRVLFIEPPFQRFMNFPRYFFPYSLGYLATRIKKCGYETAVYDAEFCKDGVSTNFSGKIKLYQQYLDSLKTENHPLWNEIKQRIESYKPDVVGISVYSEKVGSALKIAEISKRINPQCVTIFGGPHASILPDQLIVNSNVDYLIAGEGEEAICKFLQFLENQLNIRDVDNLVYKKNGTIVHNQAGSMIQDLNTIDFPDRELLMEIKQYRPDDISMIMTSRGCPFSCSYCYNPDRKSVRWRSIENVINEIRYVKEKYNPKRFYFKDDSFTLNKARIMEFCEKLIKTKIDIKWECLTRVDLVDEDLLKIMLEAGLEIVKVGVESGSPSILKLINKAITVEQFKAAALLFNKYNIFWTTFFMIGLPYETEKDIELTKKFMIELEPKFISMSLYTPYPKTPDFDYLVKHGMASVDMDWNLYDPHSPYTYFARFINKERFLEIAEDIFATVDQYNEKNNNILAKK